MGHTVSKLDAPRRLSELLDEGATWPLQESLKLIRRLALQVQSLHRGGRTHRAIGPATVSIDEKLRPQLEPSAGSRSFGGDHPDQEFSPPELADADAVALPEGIETAVAVLEQGGHSLDPRRIDVYQLGTLLNRLLTGESILAYLYSPTANAKVPAAVRPVLQRALGHDAANRFEDCDGLIEALDEALPQAESPETPTSMHETPARGSVLSKQADTPPQGSEPAPEPPVAEGLPFERLGPYQILDRIGSGGMGDVYMGYEKSLERQVAIKVLPAELARDEDFVRRFHAEATAAAKVAHPNVVPVYFSGEDAGHHFFAMQFIEGESLSQRLSRRQRLPSDEALDVATQCLAGLEVAHARGLIHRDIKPANILIEGESGRAVLTISGWSGGWDTANG